MRRTGNVSPYVTDHRVQAHDDVSELVSQVRWALPLRFLQTHAQCVNRLQNVIVKIAREPLALGDLFEQRLVAPSEFGGAFRNARFQHGLRLAQLVFSTVARLHLLVRGHGQLRHLDVVPLHEPVEVHEVVRGDEADGAPALPHPARAAGAVDVLLRRVRGREDEDVREVLDVDPP